MKRLTIILAACFLYIIPISPKQLLFAQQSDSTHHTRELVRRVRFTGNEFASKGVLQSIIRTHANRQILGIPGLTPWYWLWKLTKSIGEPPALLNRQTVAQDIERIEAYYNSQGYLYTKVDTTIVEFKKHRYEVSFLIHEGKPSYLIKVLYTGMPHEKSKQMQAFFRNSPITRKQINDTTFLYDRRYTTDALYNERDRITTYLKNHGYASVQKDSIRVEVKPDSLDKYHLDALFIIHTGKIYHFGNTYISLAGPNNQLHYNQFDTLKGPPLTTGQTKIFLKKDKASHTRFSLLTDQILFKPGSLFNYDLYTRTVNNYQNLGMMTVRQFGLNKNGGLADFSRDSLPVVIDLQTLKRRSLQLQLFGMQRYGYGAGAGITYTDNNTFGKAEQLQIGTKGSFEYVPSGASLNGKNRFLYSAEGNIDYSEPRLNFPFNSLNREPMFDNARTHYEASLSHVNQENYDINANFRLSQQFVVQHDPHTTSTLDLFQLEWTDATASSNFTSQLDSTFGNNELQKKFILEDFRPKINTTLRYDIRRSTTDYIQRDHGYYAEGSIEIGGNVPYLIDRYINTPGTVEGSISSFGLSSSRLTYSQYFKITLDYRRYIPLTPQTVFAYQGYLGYIYPYGKTKNVPLTQRFYAGGSNDIRGWAPFRLGPGPLEDQQLINGGEIKLAGHVELRQVILRDFLNTRWLLAAFDDFGNIWNGPRNPITTGRFAFNSFYKQIAMGAGIGIRLDWKYVIFRIDMAYRVHDLKKGWFKKNAVGLSFGIGQSF